ncbi:alpha/beta fold hydrolase [Halosimplex sp. TS25]|uniref:alpha/beta hydrolase n=1 Tax=Halosimplex rarum TaxID=3396619 RepID=UPI0039EAB79E
MTAFDPEPPSTTDARSRRTVLRTLAGLALAGGLAGCNDTSGASTDSPVARRTGTATPGSTAMPTPTVTAPPMETQTPSPTSTDTSTLTPTATATGSPTPAGRETARKFVAHLRADEFDVAHSLFTDTLASQMPRSTLERYWLGLTGQHGAVESVGSVEADTRDGAETLVVPVDCAEGDQPIELVVDGEGRISGLWFPSEYSSPDYVDESAFAERTLTLEPEGCSLPATLSVPASDDGGTTTATATAAATTASTTTADGSATDTAGADTADGVPGVVLVHGSGAHDRDETIYSNKPFRDIAQGLASRGVAVLRYEKRTYACDLPRSEWAIDDIIVDDAVHALGVLREQDEVDPERAVVAGHSVGATCVPRIAERDGSVAGGAILAGNARPFTEVYPEQVKHIFEVQGGLSAREERQLSTVKQLMSAVEDGSVADDREIGPLPGIWWKTLYEYDQVATANRVDAPLFVAHGGRDFQIPIDPALSGWREGLDDPDAHRFERYSPLSHLFQSGTEPSLTTEYVFPDNVEETLVTDLADWVAGL